MNNGKALLKRAGMKRAGGATAALWLAAAVAGVGAPAQATETGGGTYPNGAEGMMAAALPPPGTYYLGYFNYYEAGRFNDGKGERGLLPDFRVKASAAVSRFVWVTDKKILGADYAMHILVPVVHLDAKMAGLSDKRTGISDITIDPLILGWHFRNGMHVIAGVDVNVPVGSYDRTSVANFSRHYWSFQPIVTFAYYGKSGVNVDVKAMYDINLKNRSAQVNGFNPTGADYRSGNEFHVDYAATYNLSPKVQAGVSGYYYKQTTDDRIDDPAAQAGIDAMDGFRGEAFAAGPTVRVAAGKAQVIGTWQHEFTADYRPQGDKFWIKLILPLGGK